MTAIRNLLIIFLALFDVLSGSPVEFKKLDDEIKENVVEDSNYRLPGDVIPLHYNIELFPYLKDVSLT